MCGLSGYSNVVPAKRVVLARALGMGIDTRGGDACGYVGTKDDGTVSANRAVGTWRKARRWYRDIATLSTLVQHARWATHANARRQDCAHPFPVRRGGRAILWGVHNGVVDAEGSAKEAGRTYHVDSWEVFERLADGDVARINAMRGYGVLAWFERGIEGAHIVRASEDGALSIVETRCGAIVWASTDKILFDALAVAGMKVANILDPDTGKVITVSKGRAKYRPHVPIVFQPRWNWTPVKDYADFEPYKSTEYKPSWDGMKFAGEDDTFDDTAWTEWDRFALRHGL